jgi:hypothetical protein
MLHVRIEKPNGDNGEVSAGRFDLPPGIALELTGESGVLLWHSDPGSPMEKQVFSIPPGSTHRLPAVTHVRRVVVCDAFHRLGYRFVMDPEKVHAISGLDIVG